MELKPDTFGDPYTLEELQLPRPASGFAVQKLGEDCILDQRTQSFRRLRQMPLDGLFSSHREAFEAAARWLMAQNKAPDDFPMAIVPAYFDSRMQRHVLVLGVLEPDPDGKTAYLTGTPLALLRSSELTETDDA